MSIPKIIHQVYLQGEALIPENIRQSIDELRQKNPDWEYRLYDEQQILEYIQLHYSSEILALYLKIQPEYAAARSDFFRYLLMYQEGGVYLDLKSSCAYPFDKVLNNDDEFIICGWENEIGQKYEGYGKNKYLKSLKFGEYQQWNIICKAHSPFLKAVIDEVIYRIQHYSPLRYHVGRKGVLNTTGPVPYSLAIERIIHLNKYKFRYERFSENLGLIYKNADTSIVNQNHYSKQLKPVIKLNKLAYLYYLIWLYCLHPKKVWIKK